MFVKTLVQTEPPNRGLRPNMGVPIMELTKIETFAKITPVDLSAADMSGPDLMVANLLASAADGDFNACFDLGVVFSTGSHGVGSDLIEAHKWFNLAASRGHEEAAWCRADVADEMTAREIAEAQRRARAWLSAGARQAA